MPTRVGCYIKADSFGHIFSVKNKETGKKKKFLVLDSHYKQFTPPEGFETYYESHLVGRKEQYPKLNRLIKDKNMIELPEKRHLWYDG